MATPRMTFVDERARDDELVVVGVASYEEIVGKTELSFRGSVVALDALVARKAAP